MIDRDVYRRAGEGGFFFNRVEVMKIAIAKDMLG